MTATTIEGDVDTDLFTVLDFEPSEACEIYEDCDNEPVYTMTAKCCGVVYLACEQCVFDFVEDYKNKWYRAPQCRACDAYLGKDFPYVVRPRKS